MKLHQIMLTLASAAILASCSNTETKDNTTGNTDTAVLKSADNPPVGVPAAADRWHDVDWNSPVVKYEEVASKDVEVRGNDRYSIYTLGENVLFATGSAAVRKEAETNLTNIVSSINQHYPGGYIKVYGFTDSTGSTDANNKLSAERVNAVSSWLTSGGKMAADKVSVYAEGESRPAADNGTAAGRQMNRRVVIVATK